MAELVSVERSTTPFDLRILRSFSFAFYNIQAECTERCVTLCWHTDISVLQILVTLGI